jgi:hypothetical protein
MLEDPDTDWSRINLAALHESSTMDGVTLRATVKKQPVDGVRIEVSGTGRTLGAISESCLATPRSSAAPADGRCGARAGWMAWC